ncbi:hypothetical protein [Amycolatopsis thermoflava]|uniref:hypothetical protein n=1 Tax=Amycolatopsis thermoflava TaxID=84480 RepID=UPI000404DA07|nr:hypothetical protein [Amycolatopsis thermoflava]
MTQWTFPAAVDAIVAALQAAGLTVWDGPIVSGNYDDAVYIGYDGISAAGDEEPAGTTTQEWAAIGQRKRDEENTITCAVVALIGDSETSWKPVRDRIAAMVETVGQVLRDDSALGPSLGFTGRPYSMAEWSIGDYFQENGPAGMQARLLFTIRHKTRV